MAVLEYVMGGDREVYGRTVSGNQKCVTNMEQTPTIPAMSLQKGAHKAD